MPLVYKELRAVAARHLRREREGHTLAPTALVHEAYLRMVDQAEPQWRNRAHFIGCAAQIMRHVLVDHARTRNREKRGGRAVRVALDEAGDVAGGEGAADVDLVVLDEALQRLQQMNERHARVVELRYFGGLSVEETAEVLAVSPGTVKRDWTLARSWLRRELRSGERR